MLQKVNKEQSIDCSPWEGIHVLTAHPASCKLCLGFQFKSWPKQELLHLLNYSYCGDETNLQSPGDLVIPIADKATSFFL